MYNQTAVLPISKERAAYLQKQKRKKYMIRTIQISVVIILLAMWEILANIGVIDSFIMSQPSRMVKTLLNLGENGLLTHLGVTCMETLIGFLLGTVLGCLLTGVTASTYCLSLSLLLAFAMLYPEVQVLLFFVIPIRVKYFGFFAAALWVLSFLGAPLPQKLSLLLSMANVWLFFGPMAYRSVRAWVRREQWKRRNRR